MNTQATLNESNLPLALWGKKSSKGAAEWLPLMMHLQDTVEIGKRLWDEWLSLGIKDAIIRGLTFTPDKHIEYKHEYAARGLFLFLCATHDLGKATPAFQQKPCRMSYTGLTDANERRDRLNQCLEIDKTLNNRLEKAGFNIPMMTNPDATPHPKASHCILLELSSIPKDQVLIHKLTPIAAILSAHHGKPTKHDDIVSWEAYGNNYYGGSKGKEKWNQVQRQIIDFALSQAHFDSLEALPTPNQSASVLLTGLLIMADWLTSNEDYFSYIHLDEIPDLSQCHKRALRAWQSLDFSSRWENQQMHNLYDTRFQFQGNPMQTHVESIARSMEQPGILVIEAPMGHGKTEAALVAAEIMAQKAGRSGVFFALPTQATSNGIFPRMLNWVQTFASDEVHTIKLFHGKAQFNEDWQKLSHLYDSTGIGIDTDESEFESVYVNDWFSGSKKSMLADFVVGTIDQLLLGALKQKHVMLRHLGLSNKVVIIDECHAYDAYMNAYLETILSWLGVYRVPVIVLSATLPSATRTRVIKAYFNQCDTSKSQAGGLDLELMAPQEPPPSWTLAKDYPLLTWTDGTNLQTDVHSLHVKCETSTKTVQISHIRDDDAIEILLRRLENGGCAGILVNSVSRAQYFAQRLKDYFNDDEICLFHARFVMPDRAKIESEVLSKLGKPHTHTHRPNRFIVIGTQVLEQSLDIDFDLMITDLCPMDLLLQRMGRLHRHERNDRPEHLKTPECLILGTSDEHFNKASAQIYGKYLLMRTKAILPTQIQLPNDIPELVQSVYDETLTLDLTGKTYEEAEATYKKQQSDKSSRASSFMLSKPVDYTKKQSIRASRTRNNSRLKILSSIAGWIDIEQNNGHKESVRDITEGLEVIALQKNNEDQLCLLDEAQTLIPHDTLDATLAMRLAQYTVSMPPVLCYGQKILETIQHLEAFAHTQDIQAWAKSKWLKGQLFLIFEPDHTMDFGEYILTYSTKTGLMCQKKENFNVG